MIQNGTALQDMMLFEVRKEIEACLVSSYLEGDKITSTNQLALFPHRTKRLVGLELMKTMTVPFARPAYAPCMFFCFSVEDRLSYWL